MTDRVTVRVEDGVADVRLARPDKLNALDRAMFDGIAATIRAIGVRGDVRVVVLSGEGRGFSAGLDMAAMASGAADLIGEGRVHGIANLPQHAAWGWRTLPVPVIAAVHGFALGGGFQIIAGADIRIARADARLSIREVHWGLVPDMAGMALWRSLARDDVLRELTYTAREFDAAEGERLGFVTRLADDPLADALALARTIAGRSPDAVRAAKRLLKVAADCDAATILEAETREQLAVMGAPHQREQVRANLERRSPVFADQVSLPKA